MSMIFPATITVNKDSWTSIQRTTGETRNPLIVLDRPIYLQDTSDSSVKKSDNLQKSERAKETRTDLNGKEFASLDEAVTEIIKVYCPTVIAFGEYHNEKTNGIKTTGEYFSEIIPLLVSSGYDHAIIESFQTDQVFLDEFNYLREISASDPSASREERIKLISNAISYANTPIFYKTIARSFDRDGVRSLLISIILNGNLKVFGAVSDEVFEQGFSGEITHEELGKMINSGHYNAILDLLDKNAKIFIYAGATHNNIAGKTPDLSFGDEISKKIKDKYIEVDLVIPEYDQRRDWPERIVESAPKSGVKIIIEKTQSSSPSSAASQHIYIVFAKSSQ